MRLEPHNFARCHGGERCGIVTITTPSRTSHHAEIVAAVQIASKSPSCGHAKIGESGNPALEVTKEDWLKATGWHLIPQALEAEQTIALASLNRSLEETPNYSGRLGLVEH